MLTLVCLWTFIIIAQTKIFVCLSVQPRNANMVLCMTPVVPAAPKPVTTGTKLARATDPAWPAAIARLTWCSARAAALDPCPALAGDPSDAGDPADHTACRREAKDTQKTLSVGPYHLWDHVTLHALGEWDRTRVSPDVLVQTEPVSENLVPSHLLHGRVSEQLMFSLGHTEPSTGSNKDIKKRTCTKC